MATLITGWSGGPGDCARRDRERRRAKTDTAVWGLTMGSSLMTLGLVDKNLKLSIAVIAVACTAYGVYAANHWAMTQTLAGPKIAGRWSSVQNGVANLSGVASTGSGGG